MKPTHKIYRLIAIGFLLLPTVAKAEGFYIIGALGPSAQEPNLVVTGFEEEPEKPEEPEDPDTSIGLMIGVGKELNDKFAIEFFSLASGASDIKYNDGTIESSEVTTFGTALKWHYDFSDITRGFLKVGAHSWSRDATETAESEPGSITGLFVFGPDEDAPIEGTDLLIGLGAQYKLTDSLALMASHDIYYVDETNLAYTNVGVKYSF